MLTNYKNKEAQISLQINKEGYIRLKKIYKRLNKKIKKNKKIDQNQKNYQKFQQNTLMN